MGWQVREGDPTWNIDPAIHTPGPTVAPRNVVAGGWGTKLYLVRGKPELNMEMFVVCQQDISSNLSNLSNIHLNEILHAYRNLGSYIRS